MKKSLCVMLIILLLMSATLTAYAATPRAATIYPSITFSGTTATCKATIIGSSSSKLIVATIKLWHGSTCLETWTASGYSYVSFSETANVVKGETYTLTVAVTEGGVSQPEASCSETCS